MFQHHLTFGTNLFKKIKLINFDQKHWHFRDQWLYFGQDGCCLEKDGDIFAGFGGVMLDPEDGAYEFFQGKVEGEFLQILTHGGEKFQIVGQAEMIPCIISREDSNALA